MADSAPKLMFTLEDISATENRSPFPATNVSSFGEETRHKSSPNFRQIKGREPRSRTESASEAVETDHVGELAHFRSRSSSAPSSLMKAAHYGRELRRMSDEFDQIFPHLPRPKSAGAATQMTVSPSFRERLFSFFRGKSKEKIEAEDEQH